MIGKVLIMLRLREDVPLNLFETNKKTVEKSCAELNLCNEKCLLNCSYNPHKAMITTANMPQKS